MALQLVDLEEAEYTARRPQLIEEFAREAAAVFGSDYDHVLAIGDAQTPEFGAPGHLVRKAVLDGEEIAFVWVALPGVVFPDMAWLNIIEVAEKFRGQGFGTRILALVENDLAARGVHRLGLHVFGRNAGARRLYARLGYQLLNQIRASRTASIRPPSHKAAVELVPMGSPAREERVADVAGNDSVALTRDPAATWAKVRETVGALAASGEFRSIRADGHKVGWLWFAAPDDRHPAFAPVRYLYINPADRRRGHGGAALDALGAELAERGWPRYSLNIPGTHTEILALTDALGLEVVSEQLTRDF